jgi:hypothetical protein
MPARPLAQALDRGGRLAEIRESAIAASVLLGRSHFASTLAAGSRILRASSSRKATDCFDQKIDEQARTKRELAPKWMQDVNRRREHWYLRKHNAQPTGREIIFNREAHELCDAGPLQPGLYQILGIIGVERALRDNSGAIGKRKRLGPAGEQIAKAGVLLEVFDRPGRASAFEILRRRR